MHFHTHVLGVLQALGSQSALFLSTSLPGVSDERYRFGALPMVARLGCYLPIKRVRSWRFVNCRRIHDVGSDCILPSLLQKGPFMVKAMLEDKHPPYFGNTLYSLKFIKGKKRCTSSFKPLIQVDLYCDLRGFTVFSKIDAIMMWLKVLSGDVAEKSESAK